MKLFWQKLWRARIPTKVRAFGWKACQNILPAKMNLFHQQVLEDPICDECGLEPETVFHVLCQCSKAKEVWNHCHLQHLSEGKGDFTDILWQCSMDLNKDSNMLDMVLMIAWSIWRNMNEVQHGGRKLIAAAIYGLATRLLEEYYAAQETPT